MKTRTLTIMKVAAVALVASSLSSCLKDTRYIDFASATATVELPLASTGILQAQAYPIQSTPITFPVVINLASVNTLSTATTVTLIVDAAAFTAYNAANGGGYTQLPTADYSISSLTATIPAGARTATINISINSNLIDLTKAFILPISIQSAGSVTVSSYSTVLYNIQAKNAFDGMWKVSGTMNDIGAANTGRYPINYYLETQGAQTDGMYDYLVAGNFAHEITAASGATSYYGSFGPVFTFSTTSPVKITSVVNYYGQPASNSRYAQLDPSGSNVFTGDPGKVGTTFQVSYFLFQPTVIATGPRVSFNETWTYLGPRP